MDRPLALETFVASAAVWKAGEGSSAPEPWLMGSSAPHHKGSPKPDWELRAHRRRESNFPGSSPKGHQVLARYTALRKEALEQQQKKK